MNLSVIFSTFNEAQNNYFLNSLSLLSKYSSIELIVVDKNSSDQTRDIAKSAGAKVITSQYNSRGKRLDEGLSLVTAPMVLFHHPRSTLTEDGINYLLEHESLYWGAFTHQFDFNSCLLNFTSWYSNKIRGDIREIYYLDHCIFSKKYLLDKIGGFPHNEIFEDTEVSLRLREIAPSSRLHFTSKTSSVRFKRNGQWRQAILNQVMKACYHLGLDQKLMNKVYEIGLNLNSKY